MGNYNWGSLKSDSSLKKALLGFRKLDLSYSKSFCQFLYWQRIFCSKFFGAFLANIYYKPLFKAICNKIGKGLCLIDGIPFVSPHLRLTIGDNVTIYGNVGFQSGRDYSPEIEIGDCTYLGPDTRIAVAKKILIGKYCRVGARCFITDNDHHPIDYLARRNDEKIEMKNIEFVVIKDDVWVGEGSCILKGVTIGRAAIVGARSVVTEDVPDFAIVAGNPAKVIKKLNTNEDTTSR